MANQPSPQSSEPASAGPAIERHPFPPFIPYDAKVLIMGTFPPKSHRWSMEFYYPNIINDFWRVMGLIFFDDKDALWDPGRRKFRETELRQLLTEKGIALHDTGAAVRRLRDNASDKYLEIVEPVNLAALLGRMPMCHTVATTGEKAAGVIASLTGSDVPRMGAWTNGEIEVDGIVRHLQITRMPSTSRAYPMPLAKKAEQYTALFHHAGII